MLFTNHFREEIKNNLTISLPLTASQLIYSCSSFIGTALVARLGEDALAASVLVNVIWFSLSVFFFGILNSVSVLIAHEFGAKNNRGISDILGQSCLLGILVICAMFLLLSLMPFLLHLTTSKHIVIQIAWEYTFSLYFTIPGLVILILYEQFLAGINRARFVLRISLLVVPIEIPIIYVLIFGKFGLPAFGIGGIGYGFAITYSVTALFLTVYFLRSHYHQKYKFFSIAKHQFHYFVEMLEIGLPMGFMHVVEVSAFAVPTFWLAKFGTTLLAAHQIVLQYLSFIITIAFAMSQTVTIRVSHVIGKKQFNELKTTINAGLFLNLIIMLVIAFSFLSYPSIFLRLDIDVSNPANKLLIHDSAVLLGIAGILMLIDSFRIIGFGALRGIKDTKFSMYSSIIAFWIIGLSLAYLLGVKFELKGIGIWLGLTIGILSGAIMVLSRMYYLFNKRFVTSPE